MRISRTLVWFNTKEIFHGNRGININDNDLIFVPLGGSNEIGMNMNLYHFSGKWIIVDLGISFGDDTMPGVDVLFLTPVLLRPARKSAWYSGDPWARRPYRRNTLSLGKASLSNIFYPFTASLIRRKLIEKGIVEKVNLVEINSSSKFK